MSSSASRVWGRGHVDWTPANVAAKVSVHLHSPTKRSVHVSTTYTDDEGRIKPTEVILDADASSTIGELKQELAPKLPGGALVSPERMKFVVYGAEVDDGWSGTALFELPEYPSQGRRFTDVLRHFSAGFRPEDEPSKPKPQDVFEEAPLYSSFTKDNVFPKLDDSQSALDLSRSKSRSRRSKSAEPIAEGTEGMESSIGSMPSQAMGSNASRGSGGGGGTRQSFELSSSGALPPAGGYTEKYLRAPSAELLSSGGAQSTSLSSTAGVRAGAFQMMLSR